MKLASILLLALCGLAAGIQYPLSYEYDYYGEIRTGMPELRHDFAGAALKAKLLVTVAAEGEAHVQISNAEAGSVNAELKSWSRLPIPFSPLKDATELQKSFTVHFSGRQEKLEVPQGELLWMSNLRKAIVSLLRVPYVLSSPTESVANTELNKIEREGQFIQSFKKEEQTLMGTCNVQYTVTKAAPRDSMQLEELVEDAQLEQGGHRRRSRPSLQGDASDSSAYRLVRSIDFYDCKERVAIKRSTHGNLTEAGVGQLRGIMSRSSFGEYLLSGNPSDRSMRIEKAIVEGVVTLNPFGHETKKAMTITNQTLTLVKVSQQKIVPKPSSPLKQEPWAYRVESPHRRAPNSPSYITFEDQGDDLFPIFEEKYTTGYNLTKEIREELKNAIISLFNHVTEQLQKPNIVLATAYGGSADGAMAQKMASIIKKMRALLKQDLEELYGKLAAPGSSQQGSSVAKRQLFISALKATGSGAAMKVLIEKMKSKEITAIEASNIFTTLKANVKSSAILQDLVDYVMSLPDDDSVSLKSGALINLSGLLRRMCLDLSVKNYSYPIDMMGTLQCQAEEIVPKYVKYLEEKVKGTSELHLKAIYVQALANIGDRSTVRILGEIARQESTSSQTPTEIRLQAIEGLNKNRMVNTSYSLAQEILLGIAEAQVEAPIIREAAYAALFTLPKNATFWQRLALSTWREPSQRVASFQYSIIKAMANSRNPHFIDQISSAKHVLPQAKPQPWSLSLSALVLAGSYDFEENMGLTLETFRLASGSSSIVPEQLNLKFDSMLGGMKLPLLHLSTIGKGLERLLRAASDNIKGLEKRHPQDHDRQKFLAAVKEWESVAEGHKHLQQASDDESLFVQLSILRYIDIFAPITPASLVQLTEPNKSIIGSVIDKLNKNEEFEGASYYNPLETLLVIPNEMGVPVSVKVSRPTFAYSRVKASIKVPANWKEQLLNFIIPSFNISGEAITKIVQKRESLMKVLVPFVNKTLVSGMDDEASFSLPAKFFVALDNNSSHNRKIQFGVTPLLEKESVVLMGRNLPYTLVRDLFSKTDLSELRMKVIHPVGDGASFNSSMILPKISTGIDAKLEFSGDFENPFNMSSIMKHLKHPLKMAGLVNSVTTRYYQVAVLLNPEQSQTKEITGTLALVYPPRNTEGASSSRPRVVPNLSAEDTLAERNSKLAKASVQYMLSASLNLTGSEAPRKFEIVLLKFPTQDAQQEGASRKEAEFQLNLMKSKIGSAAPIQACIASSVRYPRLQNDEPLSQVLQSNLDVVVEAEVYTGEQCTKQNQDFAVKAFQRVSEERRKHVQETQARQSESGSNPAIDSTQAVKSALVYDILNAEIRETRALSNKLRNISNHISDAVHGMLFPLVSHNSININHQAGLTVINGTRSLITDRYQFWTTKQHSICFTQGVKVPAMVDNMSPLSIQLYREHSSSELQVKDASAFASQGCVIKPDSVHTFAGTQYRKSPFKCSTLAVKTDAEDESRFVILTKPKSESAQADQEIKIVYPSEAITIMIEKDEILVNGAKISREQTEVKSPSGKVIATVKQTRDTMKVTFDHRFSAELKSGKKVTVKLDSRYRSKVSGTCGRYGEGSMGDLRDSQECLYKPENGSVYAAAWVATSELEECKQSSSRAKELLEEVVKYQLDCPKGLHVQAGHRSPRRQ